MRTLLLAHRRGDLPKERDLSGRLTPTVPEGLTPPFALCPECLGVVESHTARWAEVLSRDFLCYCHEGMAATPAELAASAHEFVFVGVKEVPDEDR